MKWSCGDSCLRKTSLIESIQSQDAAQHLESSHFVLCSMIAIPCVRRFFLIRKDTEKLSMLLLICQVDLINFYENWILV